MPASVASTRRRPLSNYRRLQRWQARLLKPCMARAWRSGLRGTGTRDETRLNWDVSVYYTALRDEILSIDDPDAPGTSLSANIDKTTHAGIEALLGASFELGAGGHRIEPLISATYNAFSFDSDPVYGDNRLPSAPRWFARGEVLYRHASGFSAGPDIRFRRRAVCGLREHLSAGFVWTAGCASRFLVRASGKSSPRLAISLTVNT